MTEFAQAAGLPQRDDVEVAPQPIAVGHGDDIGSEPELVDADLLVEDVSIDGMCGVY